MKARAAAVGAPPLRYLFPSNAGPTDADGAKLAKLGLGDRLLVDLHNGAMGGAGYVDKADERNATRGWGVLNGETNCGDHTMHRALTEAADLNLYFSHGGPNVARLYARTASFCAERSGYNEGGLNDQGMSFFPPNMTWLQPPGHVHAMVARSWLPLAVNVTVAPHCPFYLDPGMFSAQAAAGGARAVLRLAWKHATPFNVTVGIAGVPNATLPLRVTTIGGVNTTHANTPADPFGIAPRSLAGAMTGAMVEVEPASYTVFEAGA